MSQIEIAKSLDALLVLGGEGKDHSRTNHTYNIYKSLDSPLYIVLSGSHSGLTNSKPEVPEAEIMKNYLLSLGVPQEIMEAEVNSLDTLGNIVFSQPILDQLLSGYSIKRLGIVTDYFHMKRGLWVARRVLPEEYEIHPLPTEKGTSLIGKIIETVVKKAWQIDLWKEGIESGNKEAFERYMKEKHPMHAENSPLGAYKIGIQLLKLLRK